MSIEAHRAAIVRFTSKATKSEVTSIKLPFTSDNMKSLWPASKDVTYIYLPRSALKISYDTKTSCTSMFICSASKLLSYDTSFLKRTQVVINGDVESNPGPIQSIQAYRAAIGSFYSKSRLLKSIDTCYCQAYEEYVCDHTKDRSVLNEMIFW